MYPNRSKVRIYISTDRIGRIVEVLSNYLGDIRSMFFVELTSPLKFRPGLLDSEGLLKLAFALTKVNKLLY